MPDRDQFAHSTKRSRDAAREIRRALDGEHADHLCAVASVLDKLFDHDGGVPSLAHQLELLERLQARRVQEPLFAVSAAQRYADMDLVDNCMQQHAKNDLDLVLCREVQRHLVGTAHIDQRAIVDCFISALVRRHVIDAKTDLTAAEHASLHDVPWPEIHRVIEPVIQRASSIIQERPTRQRLLLKKYFSNHVEVSTAIPGVSLPEGYV